MTDNIAIQAVHTVLTELGFSKKEAEVYVAIQKIQHANAHQVAKAAHIERTTVYDILEDLSVRGLITKSVVGKRQSYVAEPPTRLQEILERQRTTLSSVLPALTALQGHAPRVPVVRFYDTVEGIRRALMDTLNTKEKVRRDFASVEHIVDFLGQRFIDRQIEERVKRKIKAQSLRATPPSEGWTKKDWYLRGDNPKLLREVRHLPKTMPFSPALFINDDTVTVISSKEESYALVINSRELAQALKNLFDAAWVGARRIKP